MGFRSFMSKAATSARNFRDRLRPLRNISMGSVKSESIALVLQGPITLATFFTLRAGLFQSFMGPDRAWIELRGDVLLIYRTSDLLQLHFAAEPPVTSSEAGPQDVTALERLEAMPVEYITSLTGQVDPARIETFVLPVTKVVMKEAEMRITLRSSRNLLGTTLVFMHMEQMVEWRDAFLAAFTAKEKNLCDFTIVREVGAGASGRVYLVEDRETKEQLAMKVIEKSLVYASHDSYRHALDERLVLEMTKDHNFTLRMRYAFQNARRFFLLTEFCPGGDLYDFMHHENEEVDEDTARAVAAEILLALEHIHGMGVVYRDLKLENILVGADGHIRVADFGLSKLLQMQDGSLERTNSFCGTTEYIAPEMLNDQYYDTSLDLWAFGILLYEILIGETPFFSSDPQEVYEKIEKGPIFYPEHLSEDVRDLMESLLQREPSERLGALEGIEEIRTHKWFEKINWDEVRDMENRKGPLETYSSWMCKRHLLLRMHPTADVSRTRSRLQVSKERALASVLADVQEDMKYVVDVREKVAAEDESDGSGGRAGRKPRPPAAKRARAVMAGYSFCSD